jgi:hypothetical protein
MTTYEREHMLLQWGGWFADSAATPATDQFVGSLRFVGPGLDATDTQVMCQRMAEALSAWWRSGPDNFIPYTARLSWVKWNKIGTNGLYVNKTRTRIYTYPTAAITANSAVYPQQVALAVSWLTNVERGKGSRGRTFFPTNIQLDPAIGMRVPPAAATKVATSAIQLISRLNYAANTAGVDTPPNWTTGSPGFPPQDSAVRAAVMSPSGDGTGLITRARVGNRLDIQRRRDNDIEETYTSVGQ